MNYVAVHIADGDPAAWYQDRSSEHFAPIRQPVLMSQEADDYLSFGPIELPNKRVEVLRVPNEGDNAMLIRGHKFRRVYVRNLSFKFRISQNDDSPVEWSPDDCRNYRLHIYRRYRSLHRRSA